MSEPSRSAGWRYGERPPVAPGASRSARLAMTGIAFLAAAGGIAALWYWIQTPSDVDFITVPVSEYSDTHWPPNPWAERDGQLLLAAFPSGQNAFTFQERDRLAAVTEALRAESRRPVVVHISALATTEGGQIYLLPGHAKPHKPDTWLPLSDALDRFRECKSPYKLLILDIAKPIADIYRGPPANDVAARLDDVLTKLNPDFFVLTSCSAGELSLPSPEAQASIFGYYAAQAVSGAADGYGPDGVRDRRVSVRELAAFTAARVARWAEQNRSARQTPHLYGNGADFPLTFEAKAPPEPPSALAYPTWLSEGWKARDRERSAGLFRVLPEAARAVDAALLQAERGWLSGAGSAAQRRLAGQRDELRPLLQAEQPARALPARSLVATAKGVTIPPDLTLVLDKLIDIKSAATPAKPDDVTKAAADFDAKVKASKMAAVLAIWSRLVRDPEPSAERIRLLGDLLAATQGSTTTELLLVKRLSAWQPRSIPWPAEAVHLLLTVEDAFGQTVALAPAASPWIDKMLSEAVAKKIDGEARLFNAKTLDDVREAASILTGADRGLRAVHRQWETVQAVRQAAEDSAALVGGTARNVVNRAIDEDSWRLAVATAQSLAELLDRPPDGQALPLTEWEAALAEWKRVRGPVESFFTAESIKRLTAARDFEHLEGLLASPQLTGPDRLAAWTAVQKIARERFNKTLEMDQSDDETQKPTPPPKPAATGIDEAERAACRARVSAELLRLAGLDGQGLPNDWLNRWPKTLDDRIAQGDWRGAVRLDRIGAPGVLRSGPSPAAHQLRDEERQCRQWLAAYYTRLAQLRTAVPGASEFLEAAAADVRQPPRD